MAGGVALPPRVAGGLGAVASAAGSALEGDGDDVVDRGLPVMTAKVLEECCMKNGGYTAPELNELLMLQYKGFRRIEGLQAYRNVKSLFLECNGIQRIQNLGCMPQLTSLYLQQNCVARIEGLESLTSLTQLNLSHNNITRVEGLETLVCLEKLNLSANKIAEVEALEGLVARRESLKSIDIGCNYIEDGDALLDFWPRAMPEVECLYLHHNTCSRALKDYRRRVVSGMPKLRWLDERPVTDFERVGCEAWAVGGREAQNQAQAEFALAEREAKRKSFEDFQRYSKAAAERAKAQREAREARERERELAEQTGAVAEGWLPMPASPAPAAVRPSDAQEPQKQKELSAKVQAFLRKREAELASAAGAPAQAQGAAAAAEGPAEAQEELATDEVAAGDAAADETVDRPLGDAGEGSADAGSCPPAAFADASAASTAAEPSPFSWTAFRDRRLGSLVAEHRYRFDQVATALAEEFGEGIDERACRRRYGELTRPRAFVPPARDEAAPSGADADAAAALRANALAEMERSSGRARDAPPTSDEAVREVRDWWVRGIARASANPRRAPPPRAVGPGGADEGQRATRSDVPRNLREPLGALEGSTASPGSSAFAAMSEAPSVSSAGDSEVAEVGFSGRAEVPRPARNLDLFDLD